MVVFPKSASAMIAVASILRSLVSVALVMVSKKGDARTLAEAPVH